MSNVGDKNYSLRPRRAVRGKYREMVSMRHEDKETENDVSTMQLSLLDETQSKRKVYLLPIVVSGENELLVENTIELEISTPDPIADDNNDTSASEPYLQSSVTSINKDETNSSTVSKSSNALQKIEEILRNNDQLLESINETSPSMKVNKGIQGCR